MDKYLVTIIANEDIIDELCSYTDNRLVFVGSSYEVSDPAFEKIRHHEVPASMVMNLISKAERRDEARNRISTGKAYTYPHINLHINDDRLEAKE